jgi:SAM-dependent methyltransferase
MVAPEVVREALLGISDALLRGTFENPRHRANDEQLAFIDPLREVLREMPADAWPRLAVSFNADQVDSKLWLLEHLAEVVDLSTHRVVILGAWFGLLALMLDRLAPRAPAELVCVDIDPHVCARARQITSVLRVPPDVLCADMLALDYRTLAVGRPTVFVNTSCEHLHRFDEWRACVPADARLLLQSNDHVGCVEHVNCVPDLEAFERHARLSAVEFRGTLPLQKFRRFMLIGTA